MTELKTTQLQNEFKILLIGESCTDKYEFCNVVKISQEAPVPVIRYTRLFEKQGMAANVFNNLNKFGFEIDFITNTEKISKTRIVEEKSYQQLLRIDNDPPLQLWNGKTPLPLTEYDAIIISDYNKGFLDYSAIENLIKKSKAWVFIDTKKTDLRRFSSERVIVKINEQEYKNSTSKPKHLIVTRGDKGTLYYYNRQQVNSVFEVEKKEVIDVCGAGDTFLASFVAKFLYTKNIQDAIMFANKASSITVQHLGNYAPTYNEIENA